MYITLCISSFPLFSSTVSPEPIVKIRFWYTPFPNERILWVLKKLQKVICVSITVTVAQWMELHNCCKDQNGSRLRITFSHWQLLVCLFSSSTWQSFQPYLRLEVSFLWGGKNIRRRDVQMHECLPERRSVARFTLPKCRERQLVRFRRHVQEDKEFILL